MIGTVNLRGGICMKVQIINEKDLNNLTNLKVVKRDGTVTDFYAYKIE